MIYVHLADGFEEIEAIAIVDVLRRAELDAIIVSVSKEKAVTGAHSITVIADIIFEDADYTNCEMIILPGGMPGTTNLAAHDGLIEQIQLFHNKNKWIAAICAAPMILGNLSLLTGKQATIYPGMEKHLVGASYLDEKVVVDENFITAKGPGIAIDFALKIVEVFKGSQTVNTLRKAMII